MFCAQVILRGWGGGGGGGGGGEGEERGRGRVYRQERESNLEKLAITTKISYACIICLMTIRCQSTVSIIIVSSYKYEYQ